MRRSVYRRRLPLAINIEYIVTALPVEQLVLVIVAVIVLRAADVSERYKSRAAGPRGFTVARDSLYCRRAEIISSVRITRAEQ
jgi:hypothetical protein